jgi:hypothetical protein
MTGRHQQIFEDAAAARLSYAGLIAGFKLPTGKTDVTNSDGAVAERSLQPGTGTTDLFVGAYFRQAIGHWNASWFAQLGGQFPLNSHDEYKPGREVLFDVGGRWETTERLGLMLQLNASWKSRDSGRNMSITSCDARMRNSRVSPNRRASRRISRRIS